jgi:hypothetical protein
VVCKHCGKAIYQVARTWAVNTYKHVEPHQYSCFEFATYPEAALADEGQTEPKTVIQQVAAITALPEPYGRKFRNT